MGGAGDKALGLAHAWQERSMEPPVIVSLEPSATRLSSALITQSLPTFAGEGMVSLWKIAGENSDKSGVGRGERQPKVTSISFFPSDCHKDRNPVSTSERPSGSSPLTAFVLLVKTFPHLPTKFYSGIFQETHMVVHSCNLSLWETEAEGS